MCEQQSLAGWQLEVWSPQATPECRYVYRTDNVSGPLKLIWLDSMTNGLGTQLCSSFPISGTVKLYNDRVARSTATPIITVTGTPPTSTPSPTGTPATSTPTVVPRGTQIATRVYQAVTPGNSYAAQNWATPLGTWGDYTPSPGR